MKRTLIINNKFFSYEEEELSYETSTSITEEQVKETLQLVKDLFSQVGLEFYLYWGTLLGAVREHGVINGDEDVDAIIFDEQTLYENIPFFDRKGLHIIRIIPEYIYSFKTEIGGYMDFYVVSDIKGFSLWRLCCKRVSCYYHPKWVFKNFENINFLGGAYKCPQNPQRVLKMIYGKTWTIPIRGHKSIGEVKSRYYWKKKIYPGLLEILLWPYWRHLVLKRYSNQTESLQDWRIYRNN